MSDNPAATEAATEKSQKATGFEDLQLPVDARLQLLLGGNAHPYLTRLIGYARGEYLIVRCPVAKGLAVTINEGESLTVRAFTGVSVFTFKTHVVRALRGDLYLLLLAYPARIQATTFRSAPRVKVQMPAQATPQAGSAPGVATGVTIVDISVKGAMLKSEVALGGKEDEVGLSVGFQLLSGDEEIRLNLQGRIRNVSDKSEAGYYFFGLQFAPLEGNDQLYLQNLIYERLLEDRQAAV